MRKGQKRKKWQEKIRMLLLVGMIACGSSFPTPAHAVYSVTDAQLLAQQIQQYMAELWASAQEYAVIADIISIVSSVNTLFDTASKDATDAEITSGSMSVGASKVASAAKTRLTQAEVDGILKDTDASLRVRALTEKIPSDTTHLASSIVSVKGVGLIANFYQMVSSYALNTVESMYREEGDDGNGPGYVYDHLATLCKFGLMEEVDGTNEECRSDVTGTDGRPLSLSLSNLDGVQPLEFPKLKASDVGDGKSPDPQNTEQEFWNAALYACLAVAGSRPTPPVKEQLNTADGRVKRTSWNHCAALQSAAVRSCTNLLAFHTRPNKTDNAEIIEQQEHVRAALVDLGVEDPWDEGEGASLYTVMKAFHLACKSGDYALGQAGDGAGASDVMDTIGKCTQAWTNFEQLKVNMQFNLDTATRALSKLHQCWAQAR